MTSRKGQMLTSLERLAELEAGQNGQSANGHEPVVKEDRKSQATIIVELVLDSEIELWHDPDDPDHPWATITIDGHQENWPLGSSRFRRWLRQLYYDKVGKSPGSQGVQDAQGVLEGKALCDGDKHTAYARLAERNGVYYLDLADDEWRVVKVTDEGWEVITDPPVKFRRSRGMQALPQPVKGGDINLLRPFVNVATDDDWALLLAWLVAALRPTGPYPVLVLHGEQGSAKSTLGRLLRALVDPNSASLRSEPRDPRDLMIASNNGWVVNLDNLSRVPTWLSDGLCRLATGGGFATRELYTNDDEVLFDAQRPIIANGIEELATRADLLDRSIILYLPSIPEEKRRPERDFWSEFQEVQPYILGALLTTVSDALMNVQHVRLELLPRMADFALWGVAAESALELEPETFINAYRGNRASANVLTLDSSLVCQALLNLEDGTSWTDTATNLLRKVDGLVSEATRNSKEWPKSGQAFSNILRRFSSNLREAGVVVEFKKTRQPKTGNRLIEIRKGGEFSVTPVSGRGDTSPPGVTFQVSPADSSVTPNRAQGDDGDKGDDEIHTQSNSPQHSQYLYSEEL